MYSQRQARTGRSLFAAVCSVVVCQLAIPQPVGAQASRLGPTFPIPGFPGVVTRFPDVAYDPANNVYLAVSGAQPVAGAFVSQDGVPVRTPFTIVTTAAWTQTPRVAYSPDAGGFLVVWIDTRADPLRGAIWGRLLQYNAGAPLFLTPEFLIATAPGGAHSESLPAVAYSTGSREFLVTWMQVGSLEFDVRAQRVSNNGALLGGEIPITADRLWQATPDVWYNPQLDEFYVVYVLAPSTASIVGQRVRAGTGALVGGPTVLFTGPYENFPEVVFDASRSRYLVTWYHIGGPGQGDMYGRFVSGDGTPDGPVIPIAANPFFEGDANGTAFSPLGSSYLVVFHSINVEVWGVEVSGTGVPGTVFQVTAIGGGGNFNPRLSAHPTRPQWLAVAANSFTTVVGQRVQTASGPPPRHTLTVSRSGDGEGTITGPGIDCGTMCSASFPAGTTVVLTATPASGSLFVGWTGDTDCLDGTVTMDGPRSCGARFGRLSTRRSVDLNGDGLGDVFLYSRDSGSWLMAYNDPEGEFTFDGSGLQWARDWDIKPARLNNDEYTDLFLYRPSGEWFQALNTGGGDFTYHRPSPVWATGWQIYVARLNGDTIDDLLLYNATSGSGFQAWTNGAGGFDRFSSFGWEQNWTIHVARLNRDPLDDVFRYNVTTGLASRAVNTGDGRFTVTSPVAWTPGLSIHFLDVNGDNLDDVFTYNPAGGQWLLGVNTGSDFTFTTGLWAPPLRFWPAHLNDDVFEDLFAYNPDTGQWFQALSNGTGGLTLVPGDFWDQTEPWEFFVTELNGDLLNDVFRQSPATGRWSKCFADGAGGFNCVEGTWDPGWTAFAQR